uniref:Uncharacterized protein n=1 Tax=Trichuris muris TaxID=70415 RepID=A0A5S6Q6N4_TRIMR
MLWQRWSPGARPVGRPWQASASSSNGAKRSLSPAVRTASWQLDPAVLRVTFGHDVHFLSSDIDQRVAISASRGFANDQWLSPRSAATAFIISAVTVGAYDSQVHLLF